MEFKTAAMQHILTTLPSLTQTCTPPHLMFSGSANTTLTQVMRTKAPLSCVGGLWGGSSMAYSGSLSPITLTGLPSVGEAVVVNGG